MSDNNKNNNKQSHFANEQSQPKDNFRGETALLPQLQSDERDLFIANPLTSKGQYNIQKQNTQNTQNTQNEEKEILSKQPKPIENSNEMRESGPFNPSMGIPYDNNNQQSISNVKDISSAHKVATDRVLKYPKGAVSDKHDMISPYSSWTSQKECDELMLCVYCYLISCLGGMIESVQVGERHWEIYVTVMYESEKSEATIGFYKNSSNTKYKYVIDYRRGRGIGFGLNVLFKDLDEFLSSPMNNHCDKANSFREENVGLREEGFNPLDSNFENNGVEDEFDMSQFENEFENIDFTL